MAKLLRHVSVTDPTSDIDSLCRAVAFNWLLLGIDAHAKNYSLLLSGQDSARDWLASCRRAIG
jgi:serine/threonine-protein kinase HipA